VPRDNTLDFALARYRPDGSLDPSFGDGGLVTTDFAGGIDEARGLVLQRNGGLVAAGYVNTPSTVTFGVARYATDGSLDPRFGSGGLVITDFGRAATAFDVALQRNGIVVAGSVDSPETAGVDVALARYRADGSLDPRFGTGGLVASDVTGGVDLAVAMTVQHDGKIVTAGFGAESFLVARYRADGSLDPRFGAAGAVVTDFGTSSSAIAVALQRDGRIVAAGSAGAPGPSGDFALARYSGRSPRPRLAPGVVDDRVVDG
jgi:uncharacterized delta-60 repeat protein